MDLGDSKRKPGGAKARRPCRRRMTCPTAREISQAMASAGLGDLPQACSLEQLLERCLDAFDPDGRLHGGEYAVDLTLTTHGWVVPSAELARRLLALYQEALRDGREERALRICHFVRHWALQHPDSFLLEPALAEVAAELRRAALHEGHEGHARLLDTSHVLLPPPAWPLCAPPGPPGTPGGSPKRKLSLLFDRLDAAQLAQQLSCLEHRAFCRLSCQDCRRYVQRGGARGSPALEGAVALCNGVSHWVQLLVLAPPSPTQRAQALAKLTRTTQKLLELQNFNTLMAVVGGLCHSSISRLRDTHALLPPEVAKALSAMAELVSSRGNFGAYRRAFAACRGFRLPLLPVHLKDLAALDAALPGRLPGGRLHLPKLLGLYQHARDLRALQRLAPPFRPDPQLLGLLALSLHTLHTEEDLLRLSHAREPGCSRLLPPPPPPSEEEEDEDGVFIAGGGPRRDAWTQTEPGGAPPHPTPPPQATSAPPPALLEELAQLREERDRLLEENRRLRPPPTPPLGAMGALSLRDPPPK